MQYNLTHQKNSVCYKCPRHTGTCRKTCESGQAEALRNEADRQQRLFEAMAEYNGNRGTDGQIVKER